MSCMASEYKFLLTLLWRLSEWSLMQSGRTRIKFWVGWLIFLGQWSVTLSSRSLNLVFVFRCEPVWISVEWNFGTNVIYGLLGCFCLVLFVDSALLFRTPVFLQCWDWLKGVGIESSWLGARFYQLMKYFSAIVGVLSCVVNNSKRK